jgi:hypothetical protein
VVQALEGGDATREFLADAEVPGAPGDFVAEFEEAAGLAGDRPLTVRDLSGARWLVSA